MPSPACVYVYIYIHIVYIYICMYVCSNDALLGEAMSESTRNCGWCEAQRTINRLRIIAQVYKEKVQRSRMARTSMTPPRASFHSLGVKILYLCVYQEA